MTGLSPARTRLALLALALGGFGIGSTEFVASGLLPQIAAALLPGLDAVHHDQAIAQSGLVISAYAAGVVVGAPTIAIFAARAPRRALLLVAIGAFVIGSIGSALAPTFPLLIVARFVAALPHGAYFGVGSLVAARLLGPGKQGRGIAFVLGGLAVANVVGVPAITFLGQAVGWRWAYVAVAVVFALSFAAILWLVPSQPGDPSSTPARELRGFRHPQVWFALLTGMIGLGGLFAVESYIAPITTHLAGLPEGAVPLVLILFGVGMTAGTLAGGPLADRHAVRGLLVAFAATLAAFVVIGFVIATPVGVFATGFLLGAVTGVLAVAIQTRLIEVAPESQTLAAAANHSALNFGNSIGAYLGGVVIAAGYGYGATPWLGLVLCAVGAVFAVLSAGFERRARRRSERAGGRVLDEDAVLDRALP